MSSSGNRKASDTTRRFLWDADNEGESTSGASGRSRTTQRSGFSTRDFVVDQSVNLMDLGSTEDHRPQQQNRESTRLSLSLAGIFKESMEVENLSRFDDYGDAAPMADAEEYIDNDKRRRGNAAWNNLRAIVCSKYGLTLVVSLIGAVLVIHTMVQIENEERSIHNGVGVQNKNGTSSIVVGIPTAKEKDFNKRRADNIRSRIAERTSSLAALDKPSSPQHKALNWLVRDDKANLPHDHEALLDRYGLAVLWYSSTNSATTSLRGGWTKSDHWMTGSGICSWHGIECVPKHQTATSSNDFTPYTKSYDDNARVTGIILAENNVAGSLPDELGVMDELLILDLEHNKLEGTLPESLSPKLRDLLLGDNKLGGTLPASYSALHALHQLNLGHNAFEGSVPWEWSDRLTKLRYVSLVKNKLTGTSFPEFSKMTRLTGLYLEDNLLEGTLPDWIGGLTGLLDLRIGNNRFGGSIGALTSLQNLETLYLHNNAFTGTIPDMFDQLYRLHELVLHNNGFEGTIPRTLTHLQMLSTYGCTLYFGGCPKQQSRIDSAL
mmetsp:Transcript_21873/g.60796  ORF Transcript_21873/g.60796 Transcript_21873/m.60796 type:complete len:550 (+) Transcript_21873:366-2015(+)